VIRVYSRFLSDLMRQWELERKTKNENETDEESFPIPNRANEGKRRPRGIPA